VADSSFHSSPNVGYFPDPSNAPKSEPNYASWTWQEIEAAICGGSSIHPDGNGDTIAQGYADYTTLWEAGNTLEIVRLTLEMVAKSLADHGKALAGGSGAPWTGEAANVFYDTMTVFSQQVQANAEVLTGGGGDGTAGMATQSVPHQLVSNGNFLSWAQAEIRDIDSWYAQQALNTGGGKNADGLVHISAQPELMRAMTDDMLNVLLTLKNEYAMTISKIHSPNPTFTNLGNGPGSPNTPPPIPPPPNTKVPNLNSNNLPPPNTKLPNLNSSNPPPLAGLPAPPGSPGAVKNLAALNSPSSPAYDGAKMPMSDLTPPTGTSLSPPVTGLIPGAGGSPGSVGGLPSAGGLPGMSPAGLSSPRDNLASPAFGSVGSPGSLGGAKSPLAPGEPSLGNLESGSPAETPVADMGAADRIATSDMGAMGEFPMMPGMGGMAGSPGGPERSDASGLLGGQAEPWHDEALPEDLVAGAKAGGVGLDGFGALSPQPGAVPPGAVGDLAGLGEMGEFPMMPGMGGMAAPPGGPDRSDASGLLGGQAEPWEEEAVAEEVLAGAAVGGALLAAGGPGLAEAPPPDSPMEKEAVFGPEPDVAREAFAPHAPDPDGSPEAPRRQEAGKHSAVIASPVPDRAAEADPEDEVAAWGTVLGAAATVLTIPSAGSVDDEESPYAGGLARWRPSAAVPGVARLLETAPRAAVGPPPRSPAPDDEAVVADPDSIEPDEDEERTAADLLLGDISQWGSWRDDPGNL